MTLIHAHSTWPCPDASRWTRPCSRAVSVLRRSWLHCRGWRECHQRFWKDESYFKRKCFRCIFTDVLSTRSCDALLRPGGIPPRALCRLLARQHGTAHSYASGSANQLGICNMTRLFTIERHNKSLKERALFKKRQELVPIKAAWFVDDFVNHIGFDLIAVFHLLNAALIVHPLQNELCEVNAEKKLLYEKSKEFCVTYRQEEYCRHSPPCFVSHRTARSDTSDETSWWGPSAL